VTLEALTALTFGSMYAVRNAESVPQQPSRFYGLVDYHGGAVPDGLAIRIEGPAGENYTQDSATTASGYYNVYALSDDPDTPQKEGGLSGETLQIYIDNELATQTVTHSIGGSSSVNITIPSPTPTPTATSTNTPVPTDTPTFTPTNTPLPTPTYTATPTFTAAPTSTFTPVPTNTLTPTYTSTPLPTATYTLVPTATALITPTPTAPPDVPQAPSRFYGLVNYHGGAVPDGLEVRIKGPTGQNYTQDSPTTTSGYYNVLALSDNPATLDDPNTPEIENKEGGVNGEALRIYINNEPALEQVIHTIGGSTAQNITIPAPTPTPTPTATATSTNTPTSTSTYTNTPIPTSTFTPVPPQPTSTFTSVPPQPQPTSTFTPSNTPVPSQPTSTFTPVPSTSTPFPTATFTATPTYTLAPTNTPLPTDTPTYTPTPTLIPTDTPIPTSTATATATATNIPLPGNVHPTLGIFPRDTEYVLTQGDVRQITATARDLDKGPSLLEIVLSDSDRATPINPQLPVGTLLIREYRLNTSAPGDFNFTIRAYDGSDYSDTQNIHLVINPLNPTATPTLEATATSLATATSTYTATPTSTPTYTATQTSTSTPTSTRTPTRTPTYTRTNTPVPTPTPTYTRTPLPTSTYTPTPTNTLQPTATFTPGLPTDTPLPPTPVPPTNTPTNTPTATPTYTPLPAGSVIVTDTLASLEAIVHDEDVINNRELVVRWNLPVPTTNAHIYGSKDGGPYEFLGQTGNGTDTSFSWMPGTDSPATYQFRVFGLQGNVPLNPIDSPVIAYNVTLPPALSNLRITDNLGSDLDLTGGEDKDPFDERTLALMWDLGVNTLTDHHVYGSLNGGNYGYLARTGDGNATSILLQNLDPGIWQFRVFGLHGNVPEQPLESGTLSYIVEQPTPTPTPVPPIQNPIITDNLESLIDLTGQVDIDTAADRSLALKFSNLDGLADIHFQASVNGGPYIYIGRTGDGEATSFEWSETNPLSAGAPVPGNISFRIFPLVADENNVLHPLSGIDAGPVTYEFTPDTFIVTDHADSIVDLSGHYDLDSPLARKLSLQWSVARADIENFHAYIIQNGVRSYFGQTHSGVVDSLEWEPGNTNIVPAFRNGPQFGSEHEFDLYGLARNTSNALVPVVSLHTGPVGYYGVAITDTEQSLENLAGGSDTDPQNDRQIVIRFDLRQPGQVFTDHHVYANGVYLGRTGPLEGEGMLVWAPGNRLIHPNFRQGPQSGNYNFTVYGRGPDASGITKNLVRVDTVGALNYIVEQPPASQEFYRTPTPLTPLVTRTPTPTVTPTPER